MIVTSYWYFRRSMALYYFFPFLLQAKFPSEGKHGYLSLICANSIPTTKKAYLSKFFQAKARAEIFLTELDPQI